jgi:hypothetical protein
LALVVAISVGAVAAVWAQSPLHGRGGPPGLKGTLAAVDTAGRTITVGDQQYSLSADARIEADHTQIPLDQLAQYIGKQVGLRLNDAQEVIALILLPELPRDRVARGIVSEPMADLAAARNDVQVLSLAGKTVLQSQGMTSSALASLQPARGQQLANGIYFVLIRSTEAGVTKTVMKRLVVLR